MSFGAEKAWENVVEDCKEELLLQKEIILNEDKYPKEEHGTNSAVHT